MRFSSWGIQHFTGETGGGKVNISRRGGAGRNIVRP
jgi:hypothetical protein